MRSSIIILFWLISVPALAQTKIHVNIGGNPPYNTARLKVSFGSFPVGVDTVKIKNGKFTFTLHDTVMQKHPVSASIVLKDSTGNYKDFFIENYMQPGRTEMQFYPADTIIVISGDYIKERKRQIFKISRYTEGDVFYENYTKEIFRSRVVRPSAVDSLIAYIKKYPLSQILLQKVLDNRRGFTGQQLKNVISAFDKETLNNEYGEKLLIFTDNKIGEETHIEYANLVLKDRAGNDVKIFDELKDVNLIIFWTSWCVPCRREMPILKKLYETLKAKGVSFQFTHVSVDAKKELWEKADKQVAFPWKSLWAPKEETVAKVYNYGLPSNHLVTKDKRIYRIDVRNQEGIDEIYKALGLKPEKFDYPVEQVEIKVEH
jgi:thiol-disulfide isomerase/thioredoxin